MFHFAPLCVTKEWQRNNHSMLLEMCLAKKHVKRTMTIETIFDKKRGNAALCWVVLRSSFFVPLVFARVTKDRENLEQESVNKKGKTVFNQTLGRSVRLPHEIRPNRRKTEAEMSNHLPLPQVTIPDHPACTAGPSSGSCREQYAQLTPPSHAPFFFTELS